MSPEEKRSRSLQRSRRSHRVLSGYLRSHRFQPCHEGKIHNGLNRRDRGPEQTGSSPFQPKLEPDRPRFRTRSTFPTITWSRHLPPRSCSERKERHTQQSDATSDESEGEGARRCETTCVYFHATWCQPCRKFEPTYDRFHEYFPEVTFRKVDVDQEGEVAERYDVQQLPTFVILQNDVVVEQWSGLAHKRPAQKLTRKLKGVVEGGPAQREAQR